MEKPPARLWIVFNKEGVPIGVYEKEDAAKIARDQRRAGWSIQAYRLEKLVR